MAWGKSVVAGCVAFCNDFAPFVDEWVKKSEVRKKVESHGVLFFARVLCHLWSSKKRASARCTVFYNGFCTPKAPEVDAIPFLQAF